MIRNLPLVFAVTVVSASQAQTPRFAPGEVMARFAQGSEESAAVARAMQADPQDLRSLTAAVTALGARAGVRLQATRIGSGNWVILAIDSVALTDRVQGQLGARENVEGITRRTRVSGLPHESAEFGRFRIATLSGYCGAGRRGCACLRSIQGA